MKSLYGKIAAFTLMAGLLSACGGQTVATATPASQPTEAAVSATQAPADPATSVAPSASPATEAPDAQDKPVSFASEILPILQSRCTNCHGGQRTEKGLNLTAYSSLMSGSENGPVVTPGNAADSSFVQMIVEQKMPKRGPKLTPSQVQTITDWVNQGALNN